MKIYTIGFTKKKADRFFWIVEGIKSGTAGGCAVAEYFRAFRFC